ncbi:indole-3-pyruvate monooxygenase YUCCA10 [Carex littledalei]|uniref:indole-3-pyruvate monooxygenase n=1 Tax=Carex littledalei TaxID=544730 RepID=A0A833RU94_9POAL|nr:indole-3-pyruvate monooxygenase YUCCA10 [Carex littledalei]
MASVVVIVGAKNVSVNHGVLVTGRGNSGMEIAHDFDTHGATTTISVRSPVHIVNKELVYLGIMTQLKFLRMKFVDWIIGFLAWLKFGDRSNYGIVRPNLSPFMQKSITGLSPTTEVGTVEKIKDGDGAHMLTSDRLPAPRIRHHWKGKNGAYSAPVD